METEDELKISALPTDNQVAYRSCDLCLQTASNYTNLLANI